MTEVESVLFAWKCIKIALCVIFLIAFIWICRNY